MDNVQNNKESKDKYGGNYGVANPFPLNAAAFQQFIDKLKIAAIAGRPSGVGTLLRAPVEQGLQSRGSPRLGLACHPPLEIAFGFAIFPDRLRLAALPLLRAQRCSTITTKKRPTPTSG